MECLGNIRDPDPKHDQSHGTWHTMVVVVVVVVVWVVNVGIS